MVNSFKYLGWMISGADDDFPAVVRNLAKARAVCQRLSRILVRGEAALQLSGFFFKAVVQSVLRFSA